MIDWYWIALMMVVLHIIDDFHLQGILAELKQRSYWRQWGPHSRYADDYIPSLICHGLEWSFIVHIPMIWVYGFEPIIFIMIIVNAVVHSTVDHLKCNEHTINLIQDQIIHMMQIAFSVVTVSIVLWLW